MVKQKSWATTIVAPLLVGSVTTKVLVLDEANGQPGARLSLSLLNGVPGQRERERTAKAGRRPSSTKNFIRYVLLLLVKAGYIMSGRAPGFAAGGPA